MATHDYIISNASGAAVRADLNNALAAIVSNNSSATAPTTTYAYQWWADTGSTPNVMKLRNSANSAWITLFQLDGEYTTIPLENGTAAAPSIYFKDSGTDTGLFSGGTDQVNVSTGGVERVEWGTTEVVFNDAGNDYDFRIEGDTNANLFFIDASTDRVGIGTTSPSQALQVAGAIVATGAATTYSADGIYLQNKGSSIFDISAWRSGASASVLTFSTDSGSDASPVERFRCDSSGRLLVGTSSSRSVAGQAHLVQLESVNSSPFSGISVVNNANDGNGSYLILGKSRGTSVGSNTVVQNGDQIGGISFAAADGSNLTGTAASIACNIDAAPGSGDVPGRLVFSTTADGASSPTERMRLNASGQLLFNTIASISGTSPDLQVVNSDSGSTQIRVRHSSATAGRHWRFGADNNNTVYIINQDSNGVYITNGSTSWTSLSDERYKDIIEPITGAIEKVASLRAVIGKFKTDEEGKRRAFLIAQDVQTVLPEAVDASNPERLGVTQTDIIPLLVAALKESKERIETLEAKVAALESA